METLVMAVNIPQMSLQFNFVSHLWGVGKDNQEQWTRQGHQVQRTIPCKPSVVKVCYFLSVFPVICWDVQKLLAFRGPLNMAHVANSWPWMEKQLLPEQQYFNCYQEKWPCSETSEYTSSWEWEWNSITHDAVLKKIIRKPFSLNFFSNKENKM